MKFSFVNGKPVITTKIGNTNISFSSDGDTAISHKIGNTTIGITNKGDAIIGQSLGKHHTVGIVGNESFIATSFGDDKK